MRKLLNRSKDKKRSSTSLSQRQILSSKNSDNNTLLTQKSTSLSHFASKSSLALSTHSTGSNSLYDVHSLDENSINNQGNNLNLSQAEKLKDDGHLDDQEINTNQNYHDNIPQLQNNDDIIMDPFSEKEEMTSQNVEQSFRETAEHIPQSLINQGDASGGANTNANSNSNSKINSVNEDSISNFSSRLDSRPSISSMKSSSRLSGDIKRLGSRASFVGKSQGLQQSSLSSSTSGSSNNQQPLLSLVDQDWDQDCIKSAWVNKITNDEPKLFKAELRGSILTLYKPPQSLSFAKCLNINNSNSNDESNEEINYTSESLNNLVGNNEYIQSKNDVGSLTKASTLVDIDENDKFSTQLDQASIFGSTTVNSEKLIRNDSQDQKIVEANEADRKSMKRPVFILNEIWHKTTEPHPKASIIGNSVKFKSLEGLCHTILFNSSDKLAFELIEVLPMLGTVIDPLTYFIKFVEHFTTVKIEEFEFYQMFKRIRYLLNEIITKYFGLLLDNEISFVIEKLINISLNKLNDLSLQQEEIDNFSILKFNYQSKKEELESLIKFQKIKKDFSLNSLSGEYFLNTPTKELLYEINCIDHKFIKHWDLRNDLSLFISKGFLCFDYWKYNPLKFDTRYHSHYLSRLIAYHLFEDPIYSKSAELRAIILSKWIELGKELCDSGNMVTWMAIAIVILDLPILRLSSTWSYVDKDLIKDVSRKWAPVVFEVRRNELYDPKAHEIKEKSNPVCRILVPKGIGSIYAKEDVIPYYGDMVVDESFIKVEFDDENTNFVEKFMDYLDGVKSSLNKWDRYYEKIKNVNDLKPTFNLENFESKNLNLSDKLHEIIAFNSNNCPFQFENIMKLSILVEPAYTGKYSNFYSTARSPLFMGSYASILFPDPLPTYHIYDKIQLIGAIGGSELLKLLNQNDQISIKKNRFAFLKHVRDMFNNDMIDFRMDDDSIIFKTQLPDIESSKPINVLINSTNNLNKRMSTMSSGEFSLNTYINEYQDYLKQSSEDGNQKDSYSNEEINKRVEVWTKSANIERLMDLLVLTSSIFGTHIKSDDVTQFKKIVNFTGPVVFQMDNVRFTKTFFSTYRTFCTTSELVDGLRKRFLGAKSASVSIANSNLNSLSDNNKFPNWDNNFYENSKYEIQWKFVAQIQLGVLEATFEFVNTQFRHFFDDISSKELFDKFLESMDSAIVNEWPKILSLQSDNKELIDVYHNLETIYKQLRNIFIKQSFTPFVGSKLLNFSEEIEDTPLAASLPVSGDIVGIIEFIKDLEKENFNVLNVIKTSDWIDCFEIIQTLISKNQLSMFNYDTQSNDTHENLIHISNIYNWILTLNDELSGNKVINLLPVKIKNAFLFYEKIRDFFLIQIIDVNCSIDDRIERMGSILEILQICRELMKNVSINNNNESHFIPSFIESIIINTILLPSSRFFSKCWIKATQKVKDDDFATEFPSISDMLPNIELNDDYNIKLNICPGWILGRIVEIACFVPNMDVSNTNLINFDKNRFLYNFIFQIDEIEKGEFGESNFQFLYKLKPINVDFKSVYNHAINEGKQLNIEGQIFVDCVKEQFGFMKLEKMKRDLLEMQLESIEPDNSTIVNETSDELSVDSLSISKSLNSNASSIIQNIKTGKKESTTVAVNRNQKAIKTKSQLQSQSHSQSQSQPSSQQGNKFKLGFFKNKLSFGQQSVERRSVNIDELPPADTVFESKPKPYMVLLLKDVNIFSTYRTPFSFAIDDHKSEISIQVNNSEEVDDWIYKLNYSKKHWFKSKMMNQKFYLSNQKLTFGAPLEFICKRDHSIVPKIIEKMLTEIELRGLEEIGIYRKSASHSVVDSIIKIINKNGDFNMENSMIFDVHNLTGCIKAFLRGLPDPLINDDLIDDFILLKGRAQDITRFVSYIEILNKLSPFNYYLIKRLTKHFRVVEQFKDYNKMTSYNLATIMGGSLVEGVTPFNSKRCFGLMNFICEDWIINYEHVFIK